MVIISHDKGKSFFEINKDIINNIKWLSLILIFSRSSWLLVLYLIAYALDVRDYGTFHFNLVIWLFIFKISGIGLDVWITHVIASDPKNIHQYTNKVIILRSTLVISALLIFGLMWVLFNLHNLDLIWVFVILGFRQVAESMRELLIGVLHGMEEMKQHAQAIIPIDILQLLVLSASILMLDIKSIKIISLVILAFSIARVIRLWVSLRYLLITRVEKDINSSESPSKFGESYFDIGKQAFPIGITSILALIIGKVDILMLGQMDTLTVVANYTFSYLFIEITIIAFGAIRKSLFPRLSNYYHTNIEKFYQLLFPILAITLAIGIILLFVVMMFTDYIIIDVYAEKYTDSRQYLKTLAFSIPFFLLATQLGATLISMQKLKTIISIQIVAVSINITMNYFLIPKYSGQGAVWATILSYIFTCCMYAFFLIKNNLKRIKIKC